MKLTLQVDGALYPVTLSEEGVTIGRGDQATIKIQANAVSRVHARVFLKDGQPFVMDMKSLNGTSLNGVTLTEPAPLHPGDKVLLGEALVMWLPEGGGTAPGAGLNMDLAPRAVASRISLEDRAFDTSGSILVPHASLEAMLAEASGQHPAGEAVTLFQRLASMAGTLLRAAGLAELLESVMGLVTAQIPCQRGFILLADPAGELVPELVWEEHPGLHTNPISRTIARTAMDNRVAILTTDARMDPRFSAGESIKIHGITSALCAPLIVEEKAFGVIYLETSLNKGGFKREDEHLLSAMANFAAVGIQREREAKFRQRLERYHSPQVVDQILKSSQSKEAPALQAQRCQISVLFADISGFTRMSEGMEPLVLAGILNRTFEAMTDQIFSRGGTLDKYIGDAIMAFFGAPSPDPDHARHAVDAAVAMQEALYALNSQRPEGYPELRMRIGINSGEAFAGDIGCEKRMDYTVMGSAVNLASRLESSVARPGQIVVGPSTAELVGLEHLRQLGAFSLKGIEQEVRPFEVLWDHDAPTAVHEPG
ncbi:MAG: adenylate/guanylate cyclase domain-containing protein [Geothrix sp.]|nr:adenylate/guanylate cyclase domain-containing protein [Geothrix sp.]